MCLLSLKKTLIIFCREVVHVMRKSHDKRVSILIMRRVWCVRRLHLTRRAQLYVLLYKTCLSDKRPWFPFVV